ncbi:MAG: hypothetical protein ACJ74V_07530 [Gaiellaceae bacterium]
MEWAALITWVLTAGGGFVLLALWLKNGGMAQGERGKIRPPLIMSHFLLAATGLVLWIVYVATDSDALAWIAFVLLAIVAALGLTMFAVWLRQRRGRAPAAGAGAARANPAAGPDGEPAEQRFPVAIVALHGILAVTTVVLVFLTAVGVGD